MYIINMISHTHIFVINRVISLLLHIRNIQMTRLSYELNYVPTIPFLPINGLSSSIIQQLGVKLLSIEMIDSFW